MKPISFTITGPITVMNPICLKVSMQVHLVKDHKNEFAKKAIATQMKKA